MIVPPRVFVLAQEGAYPDPMGLIFCSLGFQAHEWRGSSPRESFPAGVATGCNPSGGSVWGLCVCGVGPSFTGADPAPTSRWRSPLLPCRRAGQLGRWCKAYRLRLETEQGKVFAVISEATTRVNRGLDHSASCTYGTRMRFSLVSISSLFEPSGNHARAEVRGLKVVVTSSLTQLHIGCKRVSCPLHSRSKDLSIRVSKNTQLIA